MNFHCGASATQRTYNGGSPWPSMQPNSKLAVGSAMLQMGNARIVANMILSGVCERFPRLKIVSVESGIGWLPFMLEALDYHADENAAQSACRCFRRSTSSGRCTRASGSRTARA